MSFFTSLTGLNAAAAELSIASNNIANSNTTSFKRSEAKFGDIFAVSASSNAATAMGGGVTLKSISQQFSQGGLQLSENALDIAITGEGFFPMADADGSQLYTRNGSFMLNDQNQVVNADGQTLQVHPLTAAGLSDFNQALIDLVLPRNIAAEATTEVALDVRLPEDSAVIGENGDIAIDIADATTYSETQAMTFFDDAGEPYTVTIYYQKIADDVDVGGVIQDQYRAEMYIGDAAVAANAFDVSFDANGAPTAAVADQVIAASAIDGRTQDITVSFALQSHTKTFEIVDQTIDGLPEGKLVNISVEGNGAVLATYSNGLQEVAGRINLASFSSPQGLTQQGNTNYRASGNSGALEFGEPGSNGIGSLASGATERSNVDLTQELVNLISAQRNFQSNAKAMETSGTLTQTLINMRG